MGNNMTDDRDQSETAESETANVAMKRERSTIEFPYADLDLAVRIVRTIHERAGTSCETRQLAGWLDQTPESGTFRSRISAARTFGLTETERGLGTISLTTLGRDILDTGKELAARADAFLNVPLYMAMYETHNGRALPPAAALERQMTQLGVASKQAERARQVFIKSAQQASFIDQQTGRFIKPAVGGLGHGAEGHGDPSKKKNGDGGDGPTDLDPVIKGLIDKLPPPNSVWAESDRKLWLQILESSFKLIYKDKLAALPPPTSEPAEGDEESREADQLNEEIDGDE